MASMRLSFLPLALPLLRSTVRAFVPPSGPLIRGSRLFMTTGMTNAPIDTSTIIPESRPAETAGFIMQQTMLRVKDPKVSLDFYTRILGMSLLQELHFEEYKFSLYFVGYVDDPSVIPTDKAERTKWCFSQPATVELTHNWGTESDPDFKGYHNGNDEPQGFGHIGLAVPDVYKACERFEKEGVKFRKTPDGGNMKGLAFILDPDGYSVRSSC